MEYVYAAMLLHSAGKDVTEEAVTGVLKGAGVKADTARVKALVVSLKDVNIEQAIEKAAAAPVAAAAAPAAGAAEGKAEAGKKEEKDPEEEKKSEEEAAAGLGALFG